MDRGGYSTGWERDSEVEKIFAMIQKIFDTIYRRNIKHDDTFCPYDMHDGWEYYDADTQEWKEDASLQVLCVKPHM